jgi:hypothetical protein
MKPIALPDNQIRMSLTSRNIKKEDTPCKSYVADHLQKVLLAQHFTIGDLGDELGFCIGRENLLMMLMITVSAGKRLLTTHVKVNLFNMQQRLLFLASKFLRQIFKLATTVFIQGFT